MASRMSFLKDNRDWEATAKVASLNVGLVEASVLLSVQKKTSGPVSFMAGGMAKVAGMLEGGVKASIDARGGWEAGAMGAVHLGPWEGMILGSINSAGEWEVLGQGHVSKLGMLGEKDAEVSVKRGGRWKRRDIDSQGKRRALLKTQNDKQREHGLFLPD